MYYEIRATEREYLLGVLREAIVDWLARAERPEDVSVSFQRLQRLIEGYRLLMSLPAAEDSEDPAPVPVS